MACDSPPNDEASIDVAAAMSSPAEGFAKADSVRDFIFPRDHAAHDRYKLEWWYFTGNLTSADGRRFGYQFTIFRNALTPQPDTLRQSAWYSEQLYFANFALTDVKNEKFYFEEKFSTAGNSLAGTSLQPLRIFIEDWQISSLDSMSDLALPTFRVKAKAKDFAIDLTLESEKKAVLHGERGLSQKSSTRGNASYYYSFTRMNTTGEIKISGETHSVGGYSWMDREWSTSALKENQVGWDWFSLQLDDTTEIMYFQIRNSRGEADFSKGTYVFADGESEFIVGDEITLSPTSEWQNAAGSSYPSAWLLSFPSKDIKLRLKPLIADQEFRGSVRYWEGAIKISGTKSGKPISGYGYAELTGYHGSRLPR